MAHALDERGYILYTYHALCRLDERKIPRACVRAAVFFGSQVHRIDRIAHFASRREFARMGLDEGRSLCIIIRDERVVTGWWL